MIFHRHTAAAAILVAFSTGSLAQLPASPSAAPVAPPDAGPLPELVVSHDNTVIDRSCRVVIPEGTIIPDAEGDGVIHIAAGGITVEFAEGSSLVGAEFDGRWDQLSGVGVRVIDAQGVTLRNLRVHGYKVAVLARRTDGLTVETADLSDNYRQRLGSTPVREDPADWLFPHENDGREWVTRHGAALVVERSRSVTIRDIRVRRGQNGIILDRVNNSKIYDNDCSFLSGWGLACWRSSGNTIAQNAFDFCVRGHSEGVYNRGQDSAGILFFEQCNKNKVLHNSATHCGDGFFGFAGREALGESPRPADADWDYARVGCNDNFFLSNDFSYAAAHGWEMTFSEGNRVWGNRFVGNAICGIWGGYSSYTRIEFNKFYENGAMPSGDEGGAINIEHGSNNVIRANTIRNNASAVCLWWDDDARLLGLPGVRAGGADVADNLIMRNTIGFEDPAALGDPSARDRPYRGIWFRDAEPGGHFRGNTVLQNEWEPTPPGFIREEYTPGTEPVRKKWGINPPSRPNFPNPGERVPVRARDHLAGRENIVLGEWGPWDHESPLVRAHERGAGTHTYGVFGAGLPAVSGSARPPLSVHIAEITDEPAPPHARVSISTDAPGVRPYRFVLVAPVDGTPWSTELAGVIVNTEWDARLWSWTADPTARLEAWRAEADGDTAFHTTLGALDFDYRSRGPADLGLISREAAANAGIGRDRFAMIATTTIPLEPGRWRIRTVSDDGIRLFVDGEIRIERWGVHGPTPDEAIIEIEERRGVEIKVEHFEQDGWAALRVVIEPAE